MSFVDTLISAVQNLFEFLFGSFPELKKKQELHKISVRLKSMLPPMYRNDGFLLPAFASALYQFFQFLQPLRKNLYATIANPDKRIADRCREFVLETALTPEEKKLRLSLLYPDRLNELLKNTKNTAAVLAEQEKKFIQYIRLTENENFKKSASVLEELFLLRDLCDFNFQGILITFDPVFQILPENDGQNEENSGQNPDAAGEPEKAPRQPNFQSIPVSELAPQLLDLNFLMQDVNLSHDVEEAMLLLSAFMQKTQVTADMQTQFNRIFQSVSWQMTNRISAEFLLDIIKLEQRNPDFIPQNPEREKTDFIRLYQDRLKEIFQSDSKKLIQSIRKNETEKLIEQIFGKIPLETISGYNEENSALISEFTPFSFDWVLPLRLVKTFTNVFLEERFRKIFDAVIVEGFFASRTVQSSFAAAFFFCTGIPQRMENFETLFSDRKPLSIAVIKSYVEGIKAGGDFDSQLRNAVDSANLQAKNLIQQSASNYAELLSFAEIILEENRKIVPDLITNIKTIAASTKNAESFKNLDNDFQIFKNFLELLKKYAIITDNSMKK